MAKECFTVHDKVFSTRPNIAASKVLGNDFALFRFNTYGPYWRLNGAIRELYKSWLSKGNGESGVSEAEAQRCQKVIRGFIFICSECSSRLMRYHFLDGGWLKEHKQNRLMCGGVIEELDFMDVMLNILEDANIIGFDVDIINKATCLCELTKTASSPALQAHQTCELFTLQVANCTGTVINFD
ncbi:hypothetical protein Gogos_020496 [Gossypium gossypioides]|uniref:Uncharacterized protein n=1 Tax=Gossypium gossypioides TaxID=34282 RepID=A0A7J9D5H2_GOSGO|nr:hypothetical protein [Gossypium gossypioides]